MFRGFSIRFHAFLYVSTFSYVYKFSTFFKGFYMFIGFIHASRFCYMFLSCSICFSVFVYDSSFFATRFEILLYVSMFFYMLRGFSVCSEVSYV